MKSKIIESPLHITRQLVCIDQESRFMLDFVIRQSDLKYSEKMYQKISLLLTAIMVLTVA